MKKYVLLLPILFLLLPSCTKNDYREMRVYPVPAGITAARGSEQFIALRVEMPPRTHIYGNPKGPGTGKPTTVTVRESEGIVFSAQRFLPPKKFYFSGEREYTWGYEDDTRVFIPFTVLESARTGLRDIEITFDSLLCSDSAGSSSCTPKLFRFVCPVTILEKGAPATLYDQEVIAEFRRAIAPPAPEQKGQERAAGAVNEGSGGDFPGGLVFSPRYIEKGVTGLLQAVLFGIIAGFLLNFMPCVLPVVSLKVMNFVQHAGRSRKELFLLGLLFSLGILTSFAALASLAAFFGYKWGGLFQHRLFLVAMTGIVFALALSMFDVYVINAPSFAGRAAEHKRNQYADAYVKGLLATLLATPCSGPFLGGTLAWTLTQPPAVIVAVFLCIGLGMALPYLLLTALPGLLKFVPRPGEWLTTFERVMGFFLVFTVIYLLGILERSALLPMITYLGFISVGLWQFGRYGAIHQPALRRAVSTGVLVLVIVCGYLLSFNYLYRDESAGGRAAGGAFSMNRIMANRDAGKISVIEFTAAWCPNCRLVEKVTLHSGAVAAEFGRNDVDFMVADITSKNSSAERLMALLRSTSIPLLAVIPPGKSFTAPIVLRDIYSKQDVLKALAMAREQAGKEGGVEYQFDVRDIRQ